MSDASPPAPIMKTMISSCKISQSCALPVPAEATPQPGQRFLTLPSAPSPLGRLRSFRDDDINTLLRIAFLRWHPLKCKPGKNKTEYRGELEVTFVSMRTIQSSFMIGPRIDQIESI